MANMHHEVEEMAGHFDGYGRGGHHEVNDANGNGGHHMSMMKMYFHFGLGDLLLFPGLRLDSNLKMSIACFVLFIGAILHEALNYFRNFVCLCELKQQFRSNGSGNKTELVNDLERHNEPTGNGVQRQEKRNSQQQQTPLCCSGGQSGSAAVGGGCPFQAGTKSYRLIQASLQLIRTGLSLTIMLAAMTYNVCLIFAIVAGAGLGSYIFHRRNLRDYESVCH